MAALASRDRALAARLAMGVVQTSGALDRMIDAHLAHGRHVEPRVRDALRVAAYELCWMETPAAVVVSQGVELAKSVSPRAAGLANAVLHRIAEEDAPAVLAAEERLRAGSSDLTAKDAALAVGMPEWGAYQVLQSVGAEGLRRMALAQLEPAPVYAVTNGALLSVGEGQARMEEAGLQPRPSGLPGSWVIGAPARLAASGLVKNTVVVPADLAAQMVARIAAPRAGQRLLEVGQGRGTKTILLQLASLALGGLAEVSAIDSEAFKVHVAASRMAVAGISAHVRSLVFDGRALAGPGLPPELAGGFDVVFLDAPCSGTGTLRRHPEIVWGLERASVSSPRAAAARAAAVEGSQPGTLPALQLELLRAASARVRPGGTLVYATCSVLRQEDRDVVEAFLQTPEGAAFHLASVLDAPGVRALPPESARLFASCVAPDGCFASLPAAGSFDGHFCARLVRA